MSGVQPMVITLYDEMAVSDTDSTKVSGRQLFGLLQLKIMKMTHNLQHEMVRKKIAAYNGGKLIRHIGHSIFTSIHCSRQSL